MKGSVALLPTRGDGVVVADPGVDDDEHGGPEDDPVDIGLGVCGCDDDCNDDDDIDCSICGVDGDWCIEGDAPDVVANGDDVCMWLPKCGW